VRSSQLSTRRRTRSPPRFLKQWFARSH
jgi:hypothetical protein